MRKQSRLAPAHPLPLSLLRGGEAWQPFPRQSTSPPPPATDIGGLLPQPGTLHGAPLQLWPYSALPADSCVEAARPGGTATPTTKLPRRGGHLGLGQRIAPGSHLTQLPFPLGGGPPASHLLPSLSESTVCWGWGAGRGRLWGLHLAAVAQPRPAADLNEGSHSL